MAMSNSRNHVLRTESSISSKEHFRIGRLESYSVHYGHIPLVKFNATVSFDPGEAVFLTNGDQYIICFNKHICFTGRKQLTSAVFVIHGVDFLEFHPDQLTILHLKT